MKRWIILIFAVLCSVVFSASADPLKQTDDFADTIVIPYDDNDTSAGSFTFSFRYPHIDESEADVNVVNSFYLEQIEMDETNMLFLADGYAVSGESVIKDISYELKCNNDDYFSVLIVQNLTVGERRRIIWSGNTFSRHNGEVGATFDLPRLLGILSESELDDDMIDHQAEKAEDIVLEFIMDQIFENPEDIPYFDEVTFDYLKTYVSPQTDFFLDGNGDPVFFISPGVIAEESMGYLVFPIPLDDIVNEL